MDFNQLEKTTISNINEGALAELFQVELEKIIENIKNINYPHDEKREITLKVSFKTDESRSKMMSTCKSSVKLASLRGNQSLVFLEMDDKGNTIPINPANREQMPLFGESKNPLS